MIVDLKKEDDLIVLVGPHGSLHLHFTETEIRILSPGAYLIDVTPTGTVRFIRPQPTES